jgi:hypothetical protein
MILQYLINTVTTSVIEDWHRMEVQTVYGWDYGLKQGNRYLEPKTHSQLAVYKPDVDISLAMGAQVVENLQEPWTAKFPNTNASHVAIWLRYRGSVIFEWVYVCVDGCRYLLPMPNAVIGGYEVQKTDLQLAQIFFELYGIGGTHQTVEAALEYAGVKIV